VTAPPPDPGCPLFAWYDASKEGCPGTLVQAMDALPALERDVRAPLRMCCSDVFRSGGSSSTVSGRIVAGSVSVGQKVMFMPGRDVYTVKSILCRQTNVKTAPAGDSADVTVTGGGQDGNVISTGDFMCDPAAPIPCAATIEAQISTLKTMEMPILRGSEIQFHFQSVEMPVTISKLISIVNQKSGEVLRKKPKCLTANTTAMVQLKLQDSVCIELFEANRQLGRFMLRDGGATVAVGITMKLKK
jgi:elongation factor 1 alpha-like protein